MGLLTEMYAIYMEWYASHRAIARYLVLGVRVKVKGWGQGHGSRSRVGGKVKGQGQICGTQRSILGARLCRVQQRAKNSHNQSEEFVCVSNNRADAVDRPLIRFSV